MARKGRSTEEIIASCVKPRCGSRKVRRRARSAGCRDLGADLLQVAARAKRLKDLERENEQLKRRSRS
jgi:hypothetical protein